MTRRQIALVSVVVVLISVMSVTHARGGREGASRLDRLEGRVEALRQDIVSVEGILAVPPSGRDRLEAPARLFQGERRRVSSSERRIRRLQRHLARLDGRIAAVEDALSSDPSSGSADYGARFQVEGPLKERGFERRTLKKLDRWLGRLERRVEVIHRTLETTPPPTTPPATTPPPTTPPATTPPPTVTPSPSPVACPSGASVAQPGDDLNAALEDAGVGATLCFEPGIYRLRRALTPLQGQTLVFLRGAVLNGSEVVTDWTRQGSCWSSSGHQQSFSSSVTGLPDAIMCADNPGACIYEDVFLDGRPLQHVLTLSALDQPNEVFFDKPAGTIYIATNPADRLVEATVAGAAISSPAKDVTIRGATIEKFAYNGINTAADHWTIEDSEIRYVHLQGIGIYKSTGHVILGNHVHHNGVIGMTAGGVDALTVQGNEFDHNNYLHAGPPSGGYHEGSVKILGSHGVVFKGNWSHHNVGDGLWFDWDNYDVLIENNVLEHNSRNGLHYETSFDATVRYNTIRDNGTDWDSQSAGILNSTSKNVEYYGNRIENNDIRSIVILWVDRGRSATLGERQSANLYFHDNIIVLDTNFQSWVGVYWDQDPRVFTSNNRFQGNTYYAQRDGEHWWRWGGDDLTWAGWQAYGFDTTGSYQRM